MKLHPVVPVLLGSLLLSGCLLPTHLSIASWAIDGLSVLFTKKSITDHGISVIVQKDCALWRGFTEGEICREDDSITAIADAGNISDDGKSITTASLAGTNPGDSKAIYFNSIFSDLAYNDMKHDKPASWQNDVDIAEALEVIEPVAVVVVEDVEPVVVVEQIVETVVSKVPTAPILPAGQETTLSGNYMVIGSFADWSNAIRFAGRYDSLGVQIVSAKVNAGKVFRIFVGPYTPDNEESIRASIYAVGIRNIWGVKVSEDSVSLNWKQDETIQMVSVSQ